MALVNMKSKPEVEEMPGEVEKDEPRYPYGLCISLGTDELEKLNITKLPDVGSEMTITAKVFVKSVSSYDTQGEGKDNTVQMQITDMEISSAPGKQDNNSLATMLYGG